MRLLRIEEAAEQLGVHPSTLRRQIARGEFPHVRPSPGSVRVRQTDVESLIRFGRVMVTPEPVRVDA